MLAVLALGGGRFGPVSAQDATPAVECLPPVGDGAMDVATPESAMAEASPTAEEAPVGADADEATAATAAAAAENLIACWNAGNLGAFLDLVTDDFIQDALGFADRTEAANALTGRLAAGSLPTITIVEPPHDVMSYDDGRVSVDLGVLYGEYQHVDARWFFVQSGSDLLADDEAFLSPDPDVDFVTIISATLAADEGAVIGFDQSPAIPATEAVIVHLINQSDTDRTFALLQLAEGTTLNEDGTLPDGALEGAATVGSLPVAAGGIADMALIGLPAGLYVLVDAETNEGTALTINEPAA